MKKLILFLIAFILVIYSCGAIKEAIVNQEIGKQKIITQKTALISKLTGIEFVWVKDGEFLMGSDSFFDAKPRHKVFISGFYIGKYEVTQKQYQSIMGKNPSQNKGDNNPVERMSWNDTKEFCEKVSKKYNVKIRLPYEAEWEYACRAGTTTEYYWGNSMKGNYCWDEDNSGGKTHPVGQKSPNGWGVYDMSGNVWEYCLDWYDSKYYSKSPPKDPKGPSKGKYRVFRGGSWTQMKKGGVQSSRRRKSNPGSRGGSYIGFRVVSSE